MKLCKKTLWLLLHPGATLPPPLKAVYDAGKKRCLANFFPKSPFGGKTILLCALCKAGREQCHPAFRPESYTGGTRRLQDRNGNLPEKPVLHAKPAESNLAGARLEMRSNAMLATDEGQKAGLVHRTARPSGLLCDPGLSGDQRQLVLASSTSSSPRPLRMARIM